MSVHFILLGLCAYLLHVGALPNVRDDRHSWRAPASGNNITNSRAIITDHSAFDYLTLLSAPYDVNNPNPVDQGYVHDNSDGMGTTIFVLDSGFNLERFPEEQCLDQRRIDTALVPRFVRLQPLTDDQVRDGYSFPPDNMDDTALVTPDKKYHGHGTMVAIFAAGCKTGVARKANLFLIKISETVLKNGDPVQSIMSPQAQILALKRVVAEVRASLNGGAHPPGKAVVVMCSGNWLLDQMRRELGTKADIIMSTFEDTLKQLDQLGVTVLISAGNAGTYQDPTKPDDPPPFADQIFPKNFATANSPMLMVGATNKKGQLSSFTSPGRGDNPISLYAQGQDVSSYDLTKPGPQLWSGTSYSTPIVGGLAAYALGLPSNWRLCPYNPSPAAGEDSVAMCLKKYLTRTAFQRVAPDNLLADDPSKYKYPIPASILVAHNAASAPQATQTSKGEPFGDPTPCWSDETRNECKMARADRNRPRE